MDPYRILGLSPDCTNEELKNAYRNLAKKYHPDNYASDPELANMAAEKMKEINSAYDEILKIRTGNKTGYNSGSTGNYTYSNAGTGRSNNKNPIYNQVRQAINEENFRRAESLLSSIKPQDREAEWYFLHGCILLRGGYYFDALKYIETACQMDPENPEYRQVYQMVMNQAQSYSQQYQAQGEGDCESGLCRICCAMQAISCCCGGR
ncbi:MAG: J domain-containing protein [Clostridia bacterium]|nr:J domain-containing protein [Clostridia bacterium]